MPNRIPVQCPACHHELNIRAEFFGQDVSCRYCDHTFPLADRVRVACPRCGEIASFPVDWVSRWLRCARHGHPFLAQANQVLPDPGPTEPDRPGPTLLDIPALLERLETLERELRVARGDDPD